MDSLETLLGLDDLPANALEIFLAKQRGDYEMGLEYAAQQRRKINPLDPARDEMLRRYDAYEQICRDGIVKMDRWIKSIQPPMPQDP